MKRGAQGFTLIELMIAMTLLSFIALAVYQNTSQSFALRESVEQEGDFYNSLRVGLDLIGRDINHIYTPQAAALAGDLGKAANPQTMNATSAPPAPATAFWGEPINTDGVRPSRLQGEATKLSFITNDHMRMFRDTQESDFAKISYSIEDDPYATPGQGGKVLMRKESTKVFDDEQRNNTEDESQISYVLIPNIKSVQFEYLDAKTDRFDNRWDTAQGLDRDRGWPAIIRVTVEVFLPNSTESTFKITQWYRPELPL